MMVNLNEKRIFDQIQSIIVEARNTAYRQVNLLKVVTNFLIGKILVESEQKGYSRARYKDATLKKLSVKLIKQFGRGFSVDNLQLMRSFYLSYQKELDFINDIKYETVSRIFTSDSISRGLEISNQKAESQNSETPSRIFDNNFKLLHLSWSHFVLLMKMDQEERNFYEIEIIANNWSIRELERQYNSSLYERLSLSKNKDKVKQLSQQGQIVDNPSDLIKQPNILEFLGLKEEFAYSESDLESSIITRIENFLLEMGKGFLFEARQKRISFEGDDFYVDLVLYNRLLRCYVLIELKIGKLTHQDIGQLQMYVNYYDLMMKLPGENHTIGIILCKQSNKTVIEFTLPEKDKQIFAREYKLYLPAKEELKKQLESIHLEKYIK